MNNSLKISLLILTILFCHFCIAQNTNSDLKLNEKILKIDSICTEIDKNPYLVEGISEGEYLNHKGGWETYDKKNKEQTELFRIINNSTFEGYKSNKFYYWNKHLIKAIIEIQDWSSGNKKILYSATYYFENDINIKSINEDIKYSNSKNVLNIGNFHQNAFYNNK